MPWCHLTDSQKFRETGFPRWSCAREKFNRISVLQRVGDDNVSCSTATRNYWIVCIRRVDGGAGAGVGTGGGRGVVVRAPSRILFYSVASKIFAASSTGRRPLEATPLLPVLQRRSLFARAAARSRCPTGNGRPADADRTERTKIRDTYMYI